jgi:hypothetical protein
MLTLFNLSVRSICGSHQEILLRNFYSVAISGAENLTHAKFRYHTGTGHKKKFTSANNPCKLSTQSTELSLGGETKGTL